MAVKVQTTKSKQYVTRIINSVPGYINGTVPDIHKVGAVFWTTLIREMYRKIHESYEIRSMGGSDELGNSFKPLTTKTISQRPIGKGNLREFGLTKKQSGTNFKDRTRGLLTPEENRAWKRKYSVVLSQLMRRVNSGQAEKIAAGVAWNHVKSKGAETKINLLGNRNVLIMRITDAIYNSLQPTEGSDRYYRKRNNQLAEIEGTKLTLGTTVSYAKYHNQTRPVIPNNADLWIEDAVNLATNAAITHVLFTVQTS